MANTNSLDFANKIEEVSKNLPSKEAMMGKTLTQPFSGANSGARKLMFSTHKEHTFPLMKAEKGIVETGYEIRFGDYSSSITKADRNYTVIGKISKYSFAPNHHYWLILEDQNSKYLDVIERISYHHITESYGYLYNNEYLDTLQVGTVVPNGTIMQKSLAFDEYNNRKEGLNMNVAYLALDDNMEDSIIFSDVAAKRMTAPLIKPIQIMINDNDIPLNIYGDDKQYKIIPDIGEDIKDANLIALRKEKKEESYFTQSVDQLRRIMMSDERKQAYGKVLDINIYCNNEEILNTHYYTQLRMYYNELKRYTKELVEFLGGYASQNYEFSYDLQKIFANAIRVENGDNYIDKHPFSNIIVEINVLEELPMLEGDKAANRYGGKGVISAIWPQKFMPRFKRLDGEYEYVDVIFNSSTMVNRENVGQVFESSITHIGCTIIDKIKTEKIGLIEAYKMIHDFVEVCSPEQAAYMDEKKKFMNEDEFAFFIESIISSGSIHLSMRPITDAMTIDKLALLYKKFPWVEQNQIEVAMVGSDGNTRYIPARRPIVVGKQYIIRLKQFAEEKFSATSLSATNIKNENTKSRAKKDFRELYPNTPIRFGNMETNLMNHIGADAVIANMMIHSVSPQARRLVEQMYTADPFHIDIKLNSDSRNRGAEIANTYLKTIGRRLVFIKRKKERQKALFSPLLFKEDPIKTPIRIIEESRRKDYDFEQEFQNRQELYKKMEKTKAESPISFRGINRNKTLKDWEKNNK